MKNNAAIKFLTLSGFIFLIGIWIAYKTGFFKNEEETANRSSVKLNSFISDTIKVIDTVQKITFDTTNYNPTMFPTSKSLIMIDQNLNLERPSKFPFSDSSKTKKN